MTIVEEVSVFGDAPQQKQQAPVRRIPKSRKTKTVLDIGTSNVTKSEIESKIQENKDHHKDNCNGIIP